MPPGPSALRYSVALWLLAVASRWLFILGGEDRGWGFCVFYEGDAEPFHQMARALLLGATYDNGIPYHPPGFAFLLAIVHVLVGAGGGQAAVPFLAVKAVLASLSATVVPLLYLLVRRFLGHGTAVVAALLCTFSFALNVLAAAPVSEGPFQALLVGILLAVTGGGGAFAPGADGAPSGPSALRGLGVGLLCGIGCLTRAETQLLVLLIVAVGALHAGRTSGRRALVPWLLMVAGACAVVAPWTLRNYRTITAHNARNAGRYPAPLRTFVPITAYGPINLALANNALADGTFSRRALPTKAEVGILDLADPEHYRYFTQGGSIAWAFVRDDPAAFGRLVRRRWTLYFGVLRNGFLQGDWPGGLEGVRNPVDMFVPDGVGALPLLAPLVTAGLLLALGSPGSPRRFGLLVVAVTAVWLVPTSLLFGYARLGAIALPLWLALAAHALCGAAVRALPRAPASGKAPASVVALVAAALLAVDGLSTLRGRKLQATGTVLPGRKHLNPHDVVRLEPLPTDRR